MSTKATFFERLNALLFGIHETALQIRSALGERPLSGEAARQSEPHYRHQSHGIRCELSGHGRGAQSESDARAED